MAGPATSGGQKAQSSPNTVPRTKSGGQGASGGGIKRDSKPAASSKKGGMGY